MPESKLTLTAEDKTASAFRSAARNAEQLNRAMGSGMRELTASVGGALKAVDFLGIGLGKLAAGAAVGEFARRSFYGFAEFERNVTRAGLSLRLSRGEMTEVRHELDRVAKNTNTAADGLVEAFGKMASSGSRTKDQILAQMEDI